MTKTILLRLCEQLSDGLELLKERMKAKTGEAMSDETLLGVTIERGLRALLDLRETAPVDPYDRPVSQLTVRELAKMLGTDDAAAAARTHAEAKANMEQAARETIVIMRDVAGIKALLQGAYAPMRIRSAEEAESILMPVIQFFRDGPPPGSTAVMMLAWVEEGAAAAANYRPVATSRSPN